MVCARHVVQTFNRNFDRWWHGNSDHSDTRDRENLASCDVHRDRGRWKLGTIQIVDVANCDHLSRRVRSRAREDRRHGREYLDSVRAKRSSENSGLRLPPLHRSRECWRTDFSR